MIYNLSSYMKSKGVSYESHFAILRKWAKEDEEERKDKPAYVTNNPFLQFEKSNTDYDALEAELLGGNHGETG